MRYLYIVVLLAGVYGATQWELARLDYKLVDMAMTDSHSEAVGAVHRIRESWIAAVQQNGIGMPLQLPAIEPHRDHCATPAPSPTSTEPNCGFVTTVAIDSADAVASMTDLGTTDVAREHAFLLRVAATTKSATGSHDGHYMNVYDVHEYPQPPYVTIEPASQFEVDMSRYRGTKLPINDVE